MNKKIQLIIFIILAGVVHGIWAQNTESISPGQVQEKIRLTAEEHESNWSATLEKVGLIAGIILVILGLILYWNRLLNKEVKKRKAAEESLNKAVAQNKAKSAFIAGMSHELRTPLNGILGYAQILKGEPGITEKQIEGLDIIEKSGNHLLSLLNNILDIAKVESGKIELHETDFSFPDFIQSICDNIRIGAEKKGLLFVNENSKIPLSVHADERRLHQVLINLLENAVKFTDKGIITLRVGATGRSPLRIKFSIEDTGSEIAPEDLEKIFDPFHQSDGQKYQAQGTGLGLAITRNLIELMGGKLKVSSQTGLGSIFSFKLILPEIHCEKENKTPAKQKIIGIRGKAPKILMVDDNQFNRSVFKALLSPFGFEIIEAADGREGLKKALESKPDVIITDIIMPGMDGIELIKHIRQAPELKDKIIFTASASVDREDQQNSIDAGADGFFSKPIEAGHIIEQLQQIMNLEWIYEKVDKNSFDKEAKENPLTPDRLRKLPKELLDGLLTASNITDPDAAKIIVDKIREKDIILAEALDELLSEFRFDILQEILLKIQE